MKAKAVMGSGLLILGLQWFLGQKLDFFQVYAVLILIELLTSRLSNK